MPELSRFFGIVIAMYYDDHPPPHFHAVYGSDKAEIGIAPPGLIRGSLPPKALSLVMEWTVLHQEELIHAWTERTAGRSLPKIPPLR